MTIVERTSIEGRTLLLFDGLCGLCNGTVRFLIRRDSSRTLLYAPLESALGREMLEKSGLSLASTPDLQRRTAAGIVLIESALTSGQVVTTRSDAAMKVLRLLRGAWPLAARLLAVIPRWLRESAYGWIARWRSLLFGAYKVCPMPSLAEREVILGVSG